MTNLRQVLLPTVVLVTLVGSLLIAIVDVSHRAKFMSLATTSLGAYWALQTARTDAHVDNDDDN